MSRRTLYASFAALLILSLFLAPGTTHGTTANHLLITEVLYDPTGSEPAAEWLELFNPTSAPVSFEGWKVRDNLSEDAIPPFTLSPGQFLVLASSQSEFLAAFPGFSGNLLALEGPIGNGLANGGDRLLLLDGSGGQVDAVSWGSDAAAFSPPCRGVAEGQSLGRWPNDGDSDTAGDWAAQTSPNPGGPGGPGPTPTPTPTTEDTPTPTFTPDVPSPTITPTATSTPDPVWQTALLITEVFYDPVTGAGEGPLEWVEVYNPSDAAVSMASWQIEDNTSKDILPDFLLPPGAHLVIAANRAGFVQQNPGYTGAMVALESSIGNGLSNAGDRVRLIAPDGQLVDAVSYGTDVSAFDPAVPGVPEGSSIARVPSTRDTNTAGDWFAQGTPNPGREGSAVAATPTTTPTSGPSPTPTATGTRTTYLPLVVRLNEVLPAPSAVDWNHDGVVNGDDEWVELHNRTGEPVDLSGWQIDDVADGGSQPYTFPAGSVLSPHGFVLIFHGQSGISLNNDGDTVKLLTPSGAEADSFQYTSSRSDRSFSRTADDPAAWTGDYPPSPGGENVAPTPTPTATATATPTGVPAGVFLNEILPDPRSVDWDADGSAGWKDEWIELYNTRDEAAALGGWQVRDDTGSYTIAAGTVLWPKSYLLLFRAQTGLALSDWRDSVTLVRPDGAAVDRFAYDSGPGADRSFCRGGDGTGGWTRECEVTPGRANRLLPAPAPGPAANAPTPTPRVSRTTAAARAARTDSRVDITGSVTLPPGLIPQTIYVQDDSGGIKVYLRKGEFPALKVGDRVHVTGWTRDFYGETEVSVPDPSYVAWLGPGKAVAPKPITSAGMIEANEGQLVQVVGSIAKYEPRGLVLKDRGGLVYIYFPETLPWRRPFVQIGQMWAAQGVLGQSVWADSKDPGYRIIPRFKSDVLPAPAGLPVTGSGAER